MELTEIRQEIDKVDAELKALFIKRMGFSKEVATIKIKTGDAIYKPDREAEMISRLSQDLDIEIRDKYIDFLKKILELSRIYQEELIYKDRDNV